MLLAQLFLLASTLNPEPLYSAKFVPFDGGTWLYINDARRDLSAVGITESRGPDWIHDTSFVLIKGRRLKLQGQEGPAPSWYPKAILDSRRLVVSDKNGKLKTAEIASGKLRLSAPPKEINPVGLAASLIEAYESHVPDLKPSWEEGMKNMDITWFSIHGLEIGSLRYLGMVNGEFQLFNEFWTPVIKSRNKIERLQPYVKHEAGLRLGQIGFVSKEGWLVLRARRGQEDGLAWLFPVKTP